MIPCVHKVRVCWFGGDGVGGVCESCGSCDNGGGGGGGIYI